MTSCVILSNKTVTTESGVGAVVPDVAGVGVAAGVGAGADVGAGVGAGVGGATCEHPE